MYMLFECIKDVKGWAKVTSYTHVGKLRYIIIYVNQKRVHNFFTGFTLPIFFLGNDKYAIGIYFVNEYISPKLDLRDLHDCQIKCRSSRARRY